MSAEHEKVEEQLRSDVYAALVELSFARVEEKPAIVQRLSRACGKLNELIIHGKIPTSFW
jgi:hypothetical protein